MLDDVDTGCPIDWSHPLNLGRVAWWLALPHSGFRGNTFRDLVGLSGRKPNNGTLTNGPVWQGAKGRPGGASSLSLDGADDYVQLPVLTLGTSAFTIAASYRTTASGASQDIWSAAFSGSFLDQEIGLGSTGLLSAFFRDNASSSVFPEDPAATNNGAWHRCALTRSGSSYILYRDGRQVASATGAGGAVDTAGSPAPRIGAGVAALSSRPFNGALDDITVYLRALTAAGVAEDNRLSRLGYPDVLNRF